jgi:hypothetical protein
MVTDAGTCEVEDGLSVGEPCHVDSSARGIPLRLIGSGRCTSYEAKDIVATLTQRGNKG